MVNFEKHVLENGLKVLVHSDYSTPIAAVNILYDVGARDESPDKTGFAHLFEHLMFEGSLNIPRYDEPLQMAGGENNAFTTNDITNYHLSLPVENLETAFWLESDRMLSLAFSEEKLETQKSVVTEEFKQVYLNQPYGDAWLMLRPLAYKVHPYQWATIGKDLEHIQRAKLNDVEDFFNQHYCPDNAILVVAGPVEPENVYKLAEKWFGSINRKKQYTRNIAQEPVQNELRTLSVSRNVPSDVIYKVYQGFPRMAKEYYAYDLVSDILSNGSSSRLFQSLVKEQQLFSSVNAYQTGDADRGLFVITGQVMTGVSMKDAENAIDAELDNLKNELVKPHEIQKVKNKIISAFEFTHMSVQNKAMNLAIFENLGDASLLNQEVEKYLNVSVKEIQNTANALFCKEKSSVLYYMAKVD